MKSRWARWVTTALKQRPCSQDLTFRFSSHGELTGSQGDGILAAYWITFTNSGNLTATQVVISDTIPAGLLDVLGDDLWSIPMTQTSSQPLIFDVADIPPEFWGSIHHHGSL